MRADLCLPCWGKFISAKAIVKTPRTNAVSKYEHLWCQGRIRYLREHTIVSSEIF